jgi:hypothetical protein
MSREWDQDDWDETFWKKNICWIAKLLPSGRTTIVSENNVVKSSFATENFISVNLFF